MEQDSGTVGLNGHDEGEYDKCYGLAASSEVAVCCIWKFIEPVALLIISITRTAFKGMIILLTVIRVLRTRSLSFLCGNASIFHWSIFYSLTSI
ncbi:hypothetical protein CPB84DRAFT_647408 [Gymnopilus junonius]|uniref:Uncharacterized protein n=1 Tax=Gymnopilus junonius TaxID=109634 RepID=A0A9P5N9Z6_GYMJU|nr:hypothetical protein CPB84DRAFT_647408 [Gymnopilus junonius]